MKVEAKLDFQTSTAPKTGADLLIDLLINEGVETLFGYPGGAVLPIYDAIYRARGKINHVPSVTSKEAFTLLKVMHA